MDDLVTSGPWLQEKFIDFYPLHEHTLTNFLDPLTLSDGGELLWCVFKNKQASYHLMKYHFAEARRTIITHEHDQRIESIKVAHRLRQIIIADSYGKLFVYDMFSERVVHKVDLKNHVSSMSQIGPLIILVHYKSFSVFDLIQKKVVLSSLIINGENIFEVDWGFVSSPDFGKKIAVFFSLRFSSCVLILKLNKETMNNHI